MIKLYHATGTRSVRIVWLLEELELPYHLEAVTFSVPETAFAQQSPFGKLPAIEDGDTVMCESGAITEYILERYSNGRLSPPLSSPLRGQFLQWIHFAEATAMPPLGQLAWYTLFKRNTEHGPAVASEAHGWAAAALKTVEQSLDGKLYLLGRDFSAADIMMGYTLQSAQWFGVLTEEYPNACAYFARLQARPKFRMAFAL